MASSDKKSIQTCMGYSIPRQATRLKNWFDSKPFSVSNKFTNRFEGINNEGLIITFKF